ncbi:hypothetical protein L915_12809 [Phytophthora nicotianae]|uniref:Uncharacterized protein n=2 Tax=Phytophthora nicotianae TaxID=4792 RepID=W2PR45_PHYN3|nr:hypothetical protein PPTG_23824 [Phytophthora nicotianae INRA-310]ETK81713.1 hypothetical protein L915_12809 [Phytophthora nicotianae]ETN03362.1 hypothetical protein PPTG_23824 [Phytophthora nicotianae INRA-310]
MWPPRLAPLWAAPCHRWTFASATCQSAPTSWWWTTRVSSTSCRPSRTP